ncbi:uncharacterized protein P174DRAFT_437055 [Aspergillus novofumigatus IBT 16806]|uniref:Uncharacterized protein n=1 Tax=Aspergillus novofumigatus (strain IBT 16806) TaxID=1392255 RepID=A0A2I1CLZ5_ASPN1|nr:uncharacterized protein P174DRAFT_437055 [Aspergillus novofumigatus IBT 16806]PKX98634.1 hypothetical protein P174DRAFT_437055 [Aspergillus novofumigatus IBT 16806]
MDDREGEDSDHHEAGTDSTVMFNQYCLLRIVFREIVKLPVHLEGLEIRSFLSTVYIKIHGLLARKLW